MKVFIIKSKRNGQWFFRVVFANGKKACHSESYHNKKDCKKAVSHLMRWMPTADVIEK